MKWPSNVRIAVGGLVSRCSEPIYVYMSDVPQTHGGLVAKGASAWSTKENPPAARSHRLLADYFMVHKRARLWQSRHSALSPERVVSISNAT
jgi:hypothetical protein